MITKEEFIGTYICWMRSDVEAMKNNNINFPLALSVLAYIEFLGSIFTGNPLGGRGNAHEYMKECFGDKRNDYPIEVLWDVFRNGLAHEYFARGGIANGNERPAIQIGADRLKVLYSKTLADDFLESLKVFETKLSQEKLDIKLDKMRQKIKNLTEEHRKYENRLGSNVFIANAVSSIFTGVVDSPLVSRLSTGVKLTTKDEIKSMETLKFRPHLIKEILEGRKTTTWRLFDEKNLQIGDKLELLNAETLEKFTEAEVTDIKEKKLGEIEDSDYEGHEKYGSQEEMIKHYKNYYGDKVDLDTMVKIIRFKLIQ